ncbi:DNA polymerase III subunit delta [Bergeyella sp. RCAD1439]|uniref:DNA polymerase III subunit delta n=1 Tax=Bergeyella anatis TaxID=3113737 RepID=UPI002E1743EC|nr:DNA polymerase III subunit delta [Bergeyella sp. RCAD1439]
MKELDSILKSIKNKTLLPVYFFHGEEPYYIDVAVKSFENDLLAEDERAFGQTVVYGKDTTVAEVVASAKQYPMFGERNLIVVKEAQDLRMGEEEGQMLEQYFSNPIPTTVLVMAYKHKKLDARKKFAKLLQKAGMLFYSEPVKEYHLPQWISEECKKFGIQTAPNIPHLLADYLGGDLSRIANELNKLKIILKEGELLDSKIVEQHIGISKDFNVFELNNALGSRDAAKAMRIAHYIGRNPKSNSFAMIVGTIYGFFSKIIIYHTLKGESQQAIASELGVPPFFIKNYAEAARNYPLKYATRVISILREFDLKSKGLGASNADEGELLTELTYKILNVDKVKVSL